MSNSKPLPRIAAALLCGAVLGSSLRGDNLVATNDTNVTRLAEYTVSEVPLENQILPTVRPIDSVLGDPGSILDIPRSVTTVNKAWMQDRHVTDAMDFGQFSPGVYSPARYGVPAIPQVRGDLAQIYVDGQITLFTSSSIFPSFNGVEAMDIVKGPGSAVYGPQGQAAGGYVNFVTKKPYFDHEHSEIDATFNAWTSGKSYFEPEVTIDTSAPITKDLAFRVSYFSRTGGGYFENEKNRTQDLFVALTYKVGSRLTLDWWAQYVGNRFNDLTGANRVTQQFINNGTYIGGKVTAYPDEPPFGGGVVDGSYGVLDPTTAYTVKLPTWKTGFFNPTDSARTGRYQSQLVATLDLGNDAQVINRTYFEDAHDREMNLWGYDELMPRQESIQDRLEYHNKFEIGGTQNQIITGVDFRYSRLIAYQDFSIEPMFYFDLNQDPSTLVFPGYYQEGRTFGGGYAVPGAPGYSAGLFANSSNQDSHIYDSAAFLQDDITINSFLSAVIGVRFDYLKADDNSPELISVFDPETGIVSNPGTPVAKGSIFSASGHATDPSYFASLIYKATPTRSFYFTYDQVDSVLGSANFGGVNVAFNFTSSPQDYHDELETSLKTESKLYEFGYKESFLNNTLYGSAVLYQQDKSLPQLKGDPFKVKSRGIEAELVYQPNSTWSINANASYREVTDYGTAFFQQTNTYLDGYPSSITIDGMPGTGDGSPNFSSVPSNNYAGFYSPPGGRMKAPGVPQVLANLFVQYQWKSGLGIGAGPQFQGSQYANDQGTLRIPAEYELDGYLFYRRKSWSVQVSVKNITNRRNLDPIDVTFAGNDVIYVRPPISASLTVRSFF